MNEPIILCDGNLAPLVIPRDLYAKITNVAAQANMEAAELIQLLLMDECTDPVASLGTLAKNLRQMPEEL